MRGGFRRWAAGLAVAVCVADAARADDGPSPEVMARSAAGVVQVIARECAGGNRTGSGFLWETPSQVVTALHVIAGCRRLFVYFTGVGEVPATARRSLTDADLALLEVSAPAGAAPLRVAAAVPPVNATLQVIGYYFGVPTLDSRPLRVTLGSRVLSDMLPDRVRAILQAAGSPSLSVEILRLDGNLVPGLSGAPLIDASGLVVGVGSGGLENGAVGVSWAVQAHYLNALRTASLVTALPAVAGAPLFSAPGEGVGDRGVRCGELEFAYVKTRTLAQLRATIDDVRGLMQIAATTGMANDRLGGLAFDIYAERDSGGSVALPKGTQLAVEDGLCRARLASGLQIEVGSSVAQGLNEVQRASEAFEALFNPQGLFWQPDPSFTYVMPATRADGLTVRRKNFVGFAANAGAMPVADAFETLMARGRAFIGVRVSNLHYAPYRYQQCRMQPQLSGCVAVNQFFDVWTAAALGAHMATFPIN